MRRVSRRRFLEGTGTALTVAAVAPSALARPSAERAEAARSTITLTINGAPRTIEVEDRWTLAEALRDHLGLTGTKIGCDRGECGACTVLMEGKPVYSCSQLAGWTAGRAMQTGEGLVNDPLQAAFVEHDEPQCGLGTAGQLMSAKALTNRTPHPTAEPHEVPNHGVSNGFRIHRVAANCWELERTAGGWKIRRRTVRTIDGSEPPTEILRVALRSFQPAR